MPDMWEPWPDDTSICIICGGPLPEYPARIVDGNNMSGPLCDNHSIPLAAQRAQAGASDAHE